MSSLRDFQAVVTVAEERHFGRAAERLGIAQPQLSEVVRRLEQNARFKIFNRRPRVSLTAAGEVYVESLERLLENAFAGIEEARAVASGNTGTVRFGFAPISLMSRVPSVLRRFREDRPSVELKLTEGHSRRLCSGLERGELDLIITREAPLTASVQSLEVMRDVMVLAVPTDHPLSDRDSVVISELAELDFIFFSRSASPNYHDRIMTSCREHGLTPKVVQEVDGWSAILSLVSAGLGVSIVSAALSGIGFPGVSFRRLGADLADAGFWMSWRPDRLPPAAERLRSAIATELVSSS